MYRGIQDPVVREKVGNGLCIFEKSVPVSGRGIYAGQLRIGKRKEKLRILIQVKGDIRILIKHLAKGFQIIDSVHGAASCMELL